VGLGRLHPFERLFVGIAWLPQACVGATCNVAFCVFVVLRILDGWVSWQSGYSAGSEEQRVAARNLSLPRRQNSPRKAACPWKQRLGLWSCCTTRWFTTGAMVLWLAAREPQVLALLTDGWRLAAVVMNCAPPGSFSHPNRSPDSRHAYAVHLVEGGKDTKYPAENWLQRPHGPPFSTFAEFC